MKIVREISFHEMLRRFAIGEVFSEFYDTPTDEHRNKTLFLLKSGEQSKEIEGINRALVRRQSFVRTLPPAKWFLAKLPVTPDQFSVIQTIDDPGWVSYSSGTLKLIDAATYLRDAPPDTDKRVDAIISAFKQGNVEMQGITLIGQSENGPFTIAEGNARLVAVYLCCVDEQTRPISQSEIEIVLGMTAIHEIR